VSDNDHVLACGYIGNMILQGEVVEGSHIGIRAWGNHAIVLNSEN